MPARYHAVALLLSITLAYFWLQIPMLSQFSLQIFALFVIAFLVIKRFKKAKLWHILPEMASVEIILITFSFLLLVGGTGGTSSWFFPLIYVNLFFLVMASETPTAIISTIAMMLFFYALDPGLKTSTIQSLIALPLMVAIFLFARKEYDEAHLAKLAQKKDALSQETDSDDTHPAQEQPDYKPVPKSTIALSSNEDTSIDA